MGEYVAGIGEPDPLAARNEAEFVAQLRLLKIWAGNPSYERLARLSGIPRSTLVDALSPRRARLPRVEVLRKFVAACGVGGESREKWEAAWRLQHVHPNPASPDSTSAQLPLAPAGFVGRDAEIAEMHSLSVDTGPSASTVRVVLLVGPPGVGKSALAIHWAHQIYKQFPDGQLYINLRTSESSGSPAEPAEALQSFLIGLGLLPQQIPSDIASQTALYRSLISGRRVLVVLDNANSAEQVRPLLPGSSSCMTLVTSRQSLASLAVNEVAHPITLGPLTAREGRQLLVQRLGAERVSAESEAADALVERCAGLPLVLAIVAARATANPQFALTALLEELGSGCGMFENLGENALLSSLCIPFSWSYRKLSEAAASLFRLLGLHPGAEISVRATASLAGVSTQQARQLLRELANEHLVIEKQHERFAYNSLLREYATKLSMSIDKKSDRRMAVSRVLDFYLHSAYDAGRLLQSRQTSITLSPPHLRVEREVFHDGAQALAWFYAEYPQLYNFIIQYGRTRHAARVWRLAWTLTEFFERRGFRYDQIAVQNAALVAARHAADRRGLALAHIMLARTYGQLYRFKDAFKHCHSAKEIFTELGDTGGLGDAYLCMGQILSRQSRSEEACEQVEKSSEIYMMTGDLHGQALALREMGIISLRLGFCNRSIIYSRKALKLHQELVDRSGVAAALECMGRAYAELGDYRKAIACLTEALTISRELSDRQGEAGALAYLGDAYYAAGRCRTARETWKQALFILDEANHPDVKDIYVRLSTHRVECSTCHVECSSCHANRCVQTSRVERATLELACLNLGGLTMRDSQNVLMLGWRTNSILALSRHGARITCMLSPDADRRFASRYSVHRKVILESPANIEGVVAGLFRAGINPEDFELACSQQEDCIVIASALHGPRRAHLPLPTAIRLRDKAVQKQAIRKSAIPVADFRVVNSTEGLAAVEDLIPCVVKPLAGASTVNTYIVEDSRRLLLTISDLETRKLRGPWLVESYNTGTEHHVDGVVRDGRIIFLAIGRYASNVIEVREGKPVSSTIIHPKSNEDMYRQIQSFTETVMTSLDHRNGVFHMEVFINGSSIVFGECAGRIGGGVTDLMHKEQFGVDMQDEWARIQLGLPQGGCGEVTDEVCGMTQIHLDSGRIEYLPELDDLYQLPGVVRARQLAMIGETIGDATRTSDMSVAQVVVRGKNEADTDDKLQYVASWYKDAVRVVSLCTIQGLRIVIYIRSSLLSGIFPNSKYAQIMAIATGVSAVGSGAFIGSIVPYLLEILHFPSREVGTAFALAAICGLMGPVLVRIFLRWAEPAALYVLVLLLRAAGYLLIVFSANFIMYVLAASMASIFDAASPPLNQLVVASDQKFGDRTVALASMGAARNAGYSIGLLLAAVSIGDGGRVAFYSLFTFNSASFLAIAIAVIYCTNLNVSTCLKRKAPKRDTPVQANWNDRSPLKRYVVFTAGSALVWLYDSILIVLLPIWLIAEVGAPNGLYGAMLATNSCILFFMQVPLARNKDKIGAMRGLWMCLASLLSACMLFFLASSASGRAVPVVLASVGVIALTLGEAFHTLASWRGSFELAPEESRVAYLSLYNQAFIVERIGGPILMTAVVLKNVNIGWLILGIFFCAGISAMVFSVSDHFRAVAKAEWEVAERADVTGLGNVRAEVADSNGTVAQPGKRT